MAQFHKGGGGYGKNSFATLHLVDEERLLVELWIKNIQCEIPECNESAVAMMNTGVAPLLCLVHRDAYLSDPKIARALAASIRAWLQYHQADLARHAYEGQDDTVILLVDDLNKAETLLDRAMKLVRTARDLEQMNKKVLSAASNSTVAVAPPEVEPVKVRPSIVSLPASNVHAGLQLFA